MIFDVWLCSYRAKDSTGREINSLARVAVPRGHFDPVTPPEGATYRLGIYDAANAEEAIAQSKLPVRGKGARRGR